MPLILRTPEPFGSKQARACLPPRLLNFHKKKASVLLVAGSAQYLGAAILCARGAFRAGAGYVRLALPAALAPMAMALLPEAVISGLGRGSSLGLGQRAAVEALATGCHAVAVGPGLGRSRGTQSLVRALWKGLRTAAVFDADALAALRPPQRPGGPRIITPHEGEAQLILGSKALDDGREMAARLMASRWRCVALLKGPRTLVASPDGRLSANRSGSAVLATAGSGDVLTGAIAALLAQGATPYDAARLGAWIHGRAADRWKTRHSGRGLLASDLADALPRALGDAGA